MEVEKMRTAMILVLLGAGCATATKTANPDMIELGGALTNEFVSAEKTSELAARVSLDARAVEGVERPPIEIALVIDTSGSMEGAAIENARKAALAFVEALEDGDRLAVVSFDSVVRVVVPMAPVERGARPRINAAVSQIVARGTTDMAAGLERALQELDRDTVPGAVRRIVLLSDGIPNEAGRFGGIADRAKAGGITITALGLGLEYDETLLAALAQRSGGRFHFIESSTEVAKVFTEEILRLHRVIARNAILSIYPGPGISLKETQGSGLSLAGNGAAHIHLGDIHEGDRRDLVVALDARARRDGANVELLDAVLSFDDAIGGGSRIEKRLFLAARSTADAAKIEAGRNIEVERASARARIAAATTAAIALARQGKLQEGRELLERTEAWVRELAAKLKADELLAEAANLAALMSALPSYAAAARAEAPVHDQRSALESHNVKRVHDRAMQMLQDRSYSSQPMWTH